MTSLAGAVTYHLTAVWAYVPPGDSDPASGKGPEWGKAAPIGLLIWLLLGIALFLLIKSMNRNLRKVPKSFDADETADGSGDGVEGGDGSTVSDVSGDGAASGEARDGAGPGGAGPGRGRATGGDGAPGEPAAGGARRGS